MSCYETLSIIAQFLIFTATVIYAVFAWKQWRSIADQANIASEGVKVNRIMAQAAQKSADTSETTLKKVGRAYLHVTRWQLTDFIPGKDAGALCLFVNAGHRPAKIKKNFCGYCFSEKLPPIPDYKQIVPTYEGEPITVHGGAEMALPLAIYNVGTADYEAVQRKEVRLYFYGCFIYGDVLDGEHKTTFFTWYDVDSGQFSPVYDLGYNTSD